MAEQSKPSPETVYYAFSRAWEALPSLVGENAWGEIWKPLQQKMELFRLSGDQIGRIRMAAALLSLIAPYQPARERIRLEVENNRSCRKITCPYCQNTETYTLNPDESLGTTNTIRRWNIGIVVDDIKIKALKGSAIASHLVTQDWIDMPKCKSCGKEYQYCLLTGEVKQ